MAFRVFFYTDPVLVETNIFKQIEALDAGATSVIFVDEKGQYISTKFLCDYKLFFPAHVPDNKIYIELMNQSEMIEATCFTLLNRYNESIPIIKNGIVKGYVKKRSEQRFKLDLCWDLIDDETFSKLLLNYNKVIFSSAQKDLMELYNRIKSLKNVCILGESNYEDLLNGKYDLIISACEIWNNIPIDFIHIKHLYINAYCSQLKKFMDANEVNYKFLSIPDASRIINHSKRVAQESKPFINNIVADNGTFTIADGTIDDCKYFHGRRRTTDVPLLWTKTIYFFGPCISIGIFAHDEDTIESILQRALNKAELPFRVINIPAPLLLNPFDTSINTLHKIGMEKYRKGDIILHFGRQSLEWEGVIKDDITKYDLTNIFNTSANMSKRCFIGHMGAHMNRSGYRIVADFIFDSIIKDHCDISHQKSRYYQFQSEDEKHIQEGLSKYLKFLKMQKFNCNSDAIIGAVAINANPFTLGHAHLIQSALKRTDYLYVFVAEEDLSDFSFEDRFNIVVEYCRSYQNIKVLPSGRYFASTISFGDYFNRDALKAVSIDASFDCNIFSTVISKELNISFRMLGEELYDDITHQYNEFVKEILEKNGIEVIVIPRFQVDGKIVSAKNVRKCIAKQEYSELKTMVPKSTYDYIISKLK